MDTNIPLAELTPPPPWANRNLTELDLSYITSLTDGATNKEIARSRAVTENVVKLCLKKIMIKLGLKNRTALALWGLSVGLIPAPKLKEKE